MRTIKFRRKKQRQNAALNTTSTADISFILLIFFLVTTSLDTDKGLMRQLPPIQKEENNEIMQIDREKVLEIEINADNAIIVDGIQTTTSQLAEKLEKFITAAPTDHVVSIHADRESEFDVYFQVQNTLVGVYQDLRDEYCRKQFNRPYAKCSQENQSAAVKAFPQRISEQIDAADDRQAITTERR
ncbi:MAG: ExbD/TolR family protein [Prevotella sp.]